jgi:hypothetical protein
MLIYTVCSVIHADQHSPTRPPRAMAASPSHVSLPTCHSPQTKQRRGHLPLHHTRRRHSSLSRVWRWRPYLSTMCSGGGAPLPLQRARKPTQPYLSLIAPVNPPRGLGMSVTRFMCFFFLGVQVRKQDVEAEGRTRCSSSCGRPARGRCPACRRSGRRSTTSRRATSSR